MGVFAGSARRLSFLPLSRSQSARSAAIHPLGLGDPCPSHIPKWRVRHNESFRGDALNVAGPGNLLKESGFGLTYAQDQYSLVHEPSSGFLIGDSARVVGMDRPRPGSIG